MKNIPAQHFTPLNEVTSEEIDILRGVAALGVIFWHTLYNNFVLLDGAFWVWLFLITSGFLQAHFFLSGRYSKDFIGWGKYYFNRLIRILPLFWFILFLGWCVYFRVNGSFDFIQFLRELFCLTGDYHSVGPFWTIACEMQFYLLVPLFVMLLDKQRFWIFLVIFGITVAHVIQIDDNPLQPRLLLGNLPFFLLGMMIAYMRTLELRINAYIKCAVCVLLVYVALHMSSVDVEFLIKHWLAKLACCVALFSLLFQSQRSALHRFCLPLRFLGKYCYGIYAYSALIGITCLMLLQIKPGYVLFLCQMGAIPLAYFSYHVFEKRFLKFRL